MKRDIPVTILLRCLCMPASVCRDLLGYNSTCMDGFQNYLTQLLSLRRSAI